MYEIEAHEYWQVGMERYSFEDEKIPVIAIRREYDIFIKGVKFNREKFYHLSSINKLRGSKFKKAIIIGPLCDPYWKLLNWVQNGPQAD